jgi:hypothetical protein
VHKRLRFLLLGLLLPLVAAGCEDPGFGILDPVIVTADVQLTDPVAGQPQLPTALDITAVGGSIRGGRFPERVQDANEGWDMGVRLREGQLVLVPAAALGFASTAGIAGPIAGQTFEGLQEVPAGLRFLTEEAIAIETGAVYVVRSRDFTQQFLGRCVQFAKLQASELDVQAGTLQLRVVTNERCFDTRLVPAGS